MRFLANPKAAEVKVSHTALSLNVIKSVGHQTPK